MYDIHFNMINISHFIYDLKTWNFNIFSEIILQSVQQGIPPEALCLGIPVVQKKRKPEKLKLKVKPKNANKFDLDEIISILPKLHTAGGVMKFLIGSRDPTLHDEEHCTIRIDLMEKKYLAIKYL